MPLTYAERARLKREQAAARAPVAAPAPVAARAPVAAPAPAARPALPVPSGPLTYAQRAALRRGEEIDIPRPVAAQMPPVAPPIGMGPSQQIPGMGLAQPAVMPPMGGDLRSQIQSAQQQFRASPEMQGLQATHMALAITPQAQAISQLGQSIQMQGRQPTAQEMAQLQQLNAELQSTPQYKSMMTAQQAVNASPAVMNMNKMQEQYNQQMQPQRNLAMGSLGMGIQAPQNALQPYNPNMAQLPQSGLQPYNPNMAQLPQSGLQPYNPNMAQLPQSGLQPYNPIQAQVGAPGTGLGTNMQSMQPGMQAPQQSAFQGNQQTPAVQSSQPNPMNSGIGTLMKQPSPTQSGGGGGVM